MTNNELFQNEKISKLLLRLAPPVMIAQLIQALYNIVDSYFIGKFSTDGLAALSVIFPIQLLISALAVGTGVGVNTIMSKYDGLERRKNANEAAGTGFLLAILNWVVFALITCLLMKAYTEISLKSAAAQQYAYEYGMIICACGFGIFAESNQSKILQARGDMKTPMIAQIAGAATNIILDYLLIFGIGIFPKLGIKGAAVATVCGQILAAIIVEIKVFYKPPQLKKAKKYSAEIYKAGLPNILMNALCTVYIIVFNLILVRFSDDAVTVLGLYYKLQTFYLIPVLGLTTCIVPILSYNYAAKNTTRCRDILRQSVIISVICMGIGTLLFELLPTQLLEIFAKGETQILQIGAIALRIIAISFMPLAISLIMPTYFQAIGMNKQSIFITVLRQIFLLIPLAALFSLLGLNCVWLAFPITEIITAGVAIILYFKYPLQNNKIKQR